MRLSLTERWYSRSTDFLLVLLKPLSWLFAAVVACRRYLYRVNVLKSHSFNVPVIVVGNITVGGTGKTPFVMWLVEYLRALGYRPGVVSRGVGGKTQSAPRFVGEMAAVSDVGDEAVLITKQTACPMVVGIDRAAAVSELLRRSDCNIVISDDGLQHYKLKRDIEIVLVDGVRRFGNACLLPAGPLRESVSRLSSVDLVVVNQGDDSDPYTMQIAINKLTNLKTKAIMSINSMQHKVVHAVAGIGHPERFFQSLRQAGLTIIEHVFPDHYAYKAGDLAFGDALPIVMTEKDAVKCIAFADERCWSVSVAVEVNHACQQALLSKLMLVTKGMNHDIEEDFASRGCQSRGQHAANGGEQQR